MSPCLAAVGSVSLSIPVNNYRLAIRTARTHIHTHTRFDENKGVYKPAVRDECPTVPETTGAFLKATVAAFNGGFSQSNRKTQLDSVNNNQSWCFFFFFHSQREWGRSWQTQFCSMTHRYLTPKIAFSKQISISFHPKGWDCNRKNPLWSRLDQLLYRQKLFEVQIHWLSHADRWNLPIINIVKTRQKTASLA